MKEYEKLYNGIGSYGSKALNTVYVLEAALRQSSFSILRIDVLRKELLDILEYMELKNRFDILVASSNDGLEATLKGFTFDTHTFETLDEVEKALKLKAFL